MKSEFNSVGYRVWINNKKNKKKAKRCGALWVSSLCYASESQNLARLHKAAGPTLVKEVFE